MKNWKSVLKRILIALVIIIILFAGAFYIYTLNYYHALPMGIEALNDDTIDYTNDKNMMVLAPTDNKNHKGIIFYPGGKVEYTSYIPLMQSLAKEGYTCFIMRMPFNLAVFNQNAANKPIEEYKEIGSWYLAGHSLGGAMASAYASKNVEIVKGLILLGAYPSSDLSELDIDMISIYGSEDLILNRETFEENKIYGPKNTSYIEIKGGNHAYYGSYGDQKNDGIASITPEEQQRLTVERILEFLDH